MSKKYYKTLQEKLGSKLIDYRNNWEKAGNGEFLPKFPLHLNFELNFGCNLRCNFCPYSLPLEEWSYNVEPSKKISFKQYSRIIDEGDKHGLCSVSLNGNNEPLLNKKIIKFIKYAKNSSILEISFHTNGFLLTEDLSKDIIESGLTSIMFSIDSFSEETYKMVRNSDGYKKVLENINNFLRIKKDMNKEFPFVRVSFVKNKINYKEVDNFIGYWEKKSDGIEMQAFGNLFIGHNKYYEINNLFHLENNYLEKCYEPWRRLSIQNSGKVFPCCSTYGNEVIIGDICDNSIYEIWNGEKMKELRKSINSEKEDTGCVRCKASGLSYSDNENIKK